MLTIELYLVLKLRMVEAVHPRPLCFSGLDRDNFAFQKMKRNKRVYLHCPLLFSLSLL